MKYFQLEGTINEELVTKFMNFCNSNLSEDCTIVMNSGGGKSTLATVILDIINSNYKRFTLISAGSYSAAFVIFYFAKCKRKIVNGSLGMHHKEYLKDIYLNSDKKAIYSQDKCQLKNLKNVDDSWTNNFLTKKEKKGYKKSYDVYFTFKRMKKIFPNVEIVE